MRNAGLPSRARIHCLKTETGFTGTRAHAYDANTNRTSDGATLPTLITYTPASNRIATANGITVTHDAAGNLLADGLYTYTWDEAGRLKTISKNGTLLATYAYDHRNRRSSKNTTAAAPQGAQALLYHYDQDDHLIGETRSDGTPLRTYIWLAERPITIIEHAAISNPPRSLHLQHDHLGTPRLAKNDAGVIQWGWDSDGYGTTTPTQDPDGDGKSTVINLRFPGQYYDQESGLYYNWNRYYSPRLGRYVSPDPIGIEGGANGYAYVGGNPVIRIDPLGLMGRAPGKSIGSISGSLQAGAGGGFHYGPGGAVAESGVAIGSNGAMCFYTQVCGTVGFGIAGSLGGSVGAQTGELCSGEQEADGVFASGGDGVYGGGQATQGSDGSAGANRGFGGVGAGAAAGRVFCTTRYYCVNEPPSCKKKCQ